MRPATGGRDALGRLAHAHGIQLSYTAQGGRRVRASTDALLATLEALGVTVSSGRDLDDLLADVVRQRSEQPLEPVIVMGSSGTLSSQVVVPARTDVSRCGLTVTHEDGTAQTCRLTEVVVGQSAAPEPATSRLLALDLSGLDLPIGYHEIALDGPGLAAEALLLVPPKPTPSTGRAFGVFAPIYALRGRSDWGVGSFTELARLADHAGALGAEILGTLPMFPTFFDPPVDPSPYLPVSRLFVNELFIDVAALPEFAASSAARAVVDNAGFGRDLAELARRPKVDYGGAMSRKREVLELCAAELFDNFSPRHEEFEAFLAGHPELSSYADFRAGREGDGSVDPGARRYHLYVQFAAADQLSAATDRQAGLYLDLPVGVHPHGFDTWAHPEMFAAATVGAPPDRLAPEGQAWGFPPLHPQRIRLERYRYVIACYRHLLSYARAIRIDHVLGLQRLFWIPAGLGAEAGAYVRYRSEELLAIVAIEASRAGVVVVGEDLGTVSAGIRHAMDGAGMLHTFVYQFAATAADPLPQPKWPSLAALGSHDLPRFAAFWQGADIDDRLSRGVTTEAAAKAERLDRERLVAAVEAPLADDGVEAAFAACIGSLATGPAPYVMVDLADLEGETEPDNRPGTGPEADNWRTRLTRPLAEIIDDDRVTGALTTIAEQRRLAEPQGVSS